MSERKERKGQNHSENRNGNVWLVLAAITAAVLLSAFLFGTADRRFRYPDLISLLRVESEARSKAAKAPTTPTATDAEDASKATGSEKTKEAGSEKKSSTESNTNTNTNTNTNAKSIVQASDSFPHIRVPSTTDQNILIEYSQLRDIEVAEDAITGTVMYRSLGRGGEAIKPATRVAFKTLRTIRNEAEDRQLIELLNASGVVWDNARPSRFFENHWPELLMIGVLVMLGIMMLRRIGGVGSPMSFSFAAAVSSTAKKNCPSPSTKSLVSMKLSKKFAKLSTS